MSPVTRAGAAPPRVWQVSKLGRVASSVVAVPPSLAALGGWIQVAARPSGAHALQALLTTVAAGLFSLVAWLVSLRPKLTVTAEEVVAVNPWGTRRIPSADVVGVTPGVNGGRLRLRDGSSVLVWALSDTAAGSSHPGRRARQVMEAISAAQRRSPGP